MPWLAVHPDATEKARIPSDDGPEFTFGFWPPLPEIEIRAKLPVLSKPDVDPATNPDEFVAQSGISWELCRDAVRWSVRGWTEEGGIPAKVETVKIDGRDHQVLSDESIGVLRRAGLLVPVALRAIVMNVLTEEKKRAFEKSLDSGSKSPSTSALGASEASPSSKTAPSLGETAKASGERDAR